MGCGWGEAPASVLALNTARASATLLVLKAVGAERYQVTPTDARSTLLTTTRSLDTPSCEARSCRDRSRSARHAPHLTRVRDTCSIASWLGRKHYVAPRSVTSLDTPAAG